MVPRIHVVGLAALFICVLSGWVLYCRLKRRAQCFKETVIPVIAQLVDPGIKYKSEGMIMPLLYKDSCLYRDYDRYSGADLFYGTYRGIHFKFSYVVSEYYTETRSDSGSRSRSWHDIFRGIFFVVDFNKEFHSLTLVKPDRIEGTLGRGISSFFQKMDSSQPGKLIRMEDAAFEKAFVITSTDELEARY